MLSWPPINLTDAIARLVIDESIVRTEIIPRGQVTSDTIVDAKRVLGNLYRKPIQRIKAEFPHLQFRVETHHFITDDLKAIIFAIVTREA